MTCQTCGREISRCCCADPDMGMAPRWKRLGYVEVTESRERPTSPQACGYRALYDPQTTVAYLYVGDIEIAMFAGQNGRADAAWIAAKLNTWDEMDRTNDRIIGSMWAITGMVCGSRA
jgi:hypothetical protein